MHVGFRMVIIGALGAALLMPSSLAAQQAPAPTDQQLTQTVNPGTDTVQVRAEFANPDRILVDGQLVTVLVEEGSPDTVLMIPQQAMQIDQAGAFVLVVDKADKVEVRRIEADQGPGAVRL